MNPNAIPNIPFRLVGTENLHRETASTKAPERKNFPDRKYHDSIHSSERTQRRTIAHKQNVRRQINYADYQFVMNEFKGTPMPKRRGGSLSRLAVPEIVIHGPEPEYRKSFSSAFAEGPDDTKISHQNRFSELSDVFGSPDKSEKDSLNNQKSNGKYTQNTPTYKPVGNRRMQSKISYQRAASLPPARDNFFSAISQPTSTDDSQFLHYFKGGSLTNEQITEERKRFACLQQAILKMVCERHRLSEIVITLRNFIEQSKPDMKIPTERDIDDIRKQIEARTNVPWPRIFK
ncbi:unnamed protein product [Hymenolepis diminuta]|uniref:Uncharacterized protein n=1 Tax=Hymenolepis diminuta TaxID=6216 RepID=A0A564Y9J9_HYMDI|nr:unnamed protein product [Hymenolepis diminuta]